MSQPSIREIQNISFIFFAISQTKLVSVINAQQLKF